MLPTLIMRRAATTRRARGARAARLRPIGTALGIVVLALAGLFVATGYIHSIVRHLDYAKPSHADRSLIRSGVEREVADDPVELSIRTEDGTLRRVLADRAKLGTFVEQQLAELERDRLAAKSAASADATRVVGAAFADADERVQRYADWFFAWQRSYVLLKDATLSAAYHAISPGVEGWRAAVERDLADDFMHHFAEQVLRPEYRDPLVADGVRDALRDAHERYAEALMRHELKLQLFVQQFTTHLEARPAEAVRVELDWDAQKWKAPVWLAEDRPFDGLLGVGLMSVGAGGGKVAGKALVPAFEALARRASARVAARSTAALAGRISTSAAGAGVGAPLGGVFGAFLGFAAGAALDYLGNEADEWMSRDAFVAENRAALDAIEAEWQTAIQSELDRTIDVWFDDTQALLLRLAPGRETAPRPST
ncbi:MAG: hypothetical protein ACREH6_01625 [Geminicoccaceae bacterium]